MGAIGNVYAGVREIPASVASGARSATSTGLIVGAGVGGWLGAKAALTSKIGTEISAVLERNNVNFLERGLAYVTSAEEAAAKTVLYAAAAVGVACLARKYATRRIDT